MFYSKELTPKIGEMYSYEDDFLLLDDKNDMLPRKNLIITLLCCFVFYNILICDIYIMDRHILLKIVQISLWAINILSLLRILHLDPGIATKRLGTSKNAINFIDENVIYNRKMLAAYGLYFENDEDFCEKCSIMKKNGISHCRFCDICFKNRDHHCAWFNRCIAENNLKSFRNFLVSSSFSALILAFNILKTFTGGALIKNSYLDLIFMSITFFACSILFVLTGLLTLQYLISTLLDIQTRKLVSGRWQWKSTRIMKWMRKKKVIIENFDHTVIESPDNTL